MTDKKQPVQPDLSFYSPKQALVIYSTNPSQLRDEEIKYYVEVSDIMADGGKSFIGSGKPVTKETLQLLMDVVAKSDKQTYFSFSDIVPTNLLLLDQRPGHNIIAWWQPAKKQTIMISKKAPATCWVPPMVFVVKDDSLYVAALTNNSKPKIASRLHHAPFFNVYSDLRVCLGNVKLPELTGDIAQLITAWEKAFWNSEFTENVASSYTKPDLIRWWRKKRRGKFPTKKLKLSGRNLKSLCAND